MSAPLNRRRFARNTALAGASALFAGIGFHRSSTLGIDAAEREILSKLSQLFPRMLLRDLRTDRSRSLHAAVSIDEIGAFLDVERRQAILPDAKIHADGNSLRFHHQDTSYRLDLLLPDDFAKQTGEPVHI